MQEGHADCVTKHAAVLLATRLLSRNTCKIQGCHVGLDIAVGVPVKTVVADSVWQALATGNFNAAALSFGEKLPGKVVASSQAWRPLC